VYLAVWGKYVHWSALLRARGWYNPALAAHSSWDPGLVSNSLAFLFLLCKMKRSDRMGIFGRVCFIFSYGTLSSNKGSSGSLEKEADEPQFLWWKLGWKPESTLHPQSLKSLITLYMSFKTPRLDDLKPPPSTPTSFHTLHVFALKGMEHRVSGDFCLQEILDC